MEHVIAERRFERADGGEVIVRLGCPRPADGGADYCCPLEIDGLDEQVFFREIYGVDSMQALVLAISFVRMRLFQSPVPILWFGRESLGLPKAMPEVWDREADAALLTVIDAEIKQFLERRVPLGIDPLNELLGSPRHSEVVRRLIASADAVAESWEGGRTTVDVPSRGWSCAIDDTVISVDFRPSEACPSPLIPRDLGIDIGMRRDHVHGILGSAPMATGGASVLPILGEVAPWEAHLHDEQVVRLEYDGADRVAAVTIMTAPYFMSLRAG